MLLPTASGRSVLTRVVAPKLPDLPPKAIVSTPRSRTSTVPSRTLERTARSRRETDATVAGDGSVLRVPYGLVQMGADVVSVVTDTSYMYLLCVWGEGQIDSYQSVTVEGVEAAFLAVTNYTGAAGQGVDPWLAATISGYADTLPGVAYSVVRVATIALSGFPRPVARFQGRRLYDPRRDPSHPSYSGSGAQVLADPATWEYSTNPPLMLADFMSSSVYGCGWTVDWASVATAADAADETVPGGGARRQAGVVLDVAARIEDHLDSLRAYAGCWIVRRGGVAHLIADRPGSVARSLTASQFRDLSITVGSPTGRQRPNAVTVIYTDTSTDQWRDAEATAKTPAADGGTVQVIEDVLRLPGIQDYAVAHREAVERLNRHTLLNLRLSFLARDDALTDEIGDIIAVTDLYGLTAKQVRITRVDQQGGGDFSVEAEEYQPNVYSDEVETGPALPDTNLPLPSAVPALSGLAVAEETYRRTDGIWDTRIRVSWDAISGYPYRHSYLLEITADGQPVGDLSVIGTQADISSPIEGADYEITVYAVSQGGDTGASQTAEIVPLGEGIPPTDVPQVTVTRIAADAVLVAWLPAIDVGVLEYEIRIGADWDTALFVDRASVLERRIDNLSATGTVLVKARDSRGNYSVNATSAGFSITAPPAPLGLTGFEVGGEARLTVTPPATGYVARYEWRYGPTTGFSWAAATLINVIDTLVLVTKEVPAGTWRFAVKSIDDAGQESTGYVSRDMTVTEDAGAFLAANQALAPNLGSSTNMHLLANPWADPVETYYTSMSDTVAAMFPNAMATYTDPLVTYHTSGTSELLTDSHNFGTSINGTWTLDFDVDELSGDGADVQLEISPNGTNWTQVGTAAKTVGQYARARIGGATADTLVVSVPDLNVRVDAVPREEQGAASYAPGKYALEFDGTGDYVARASDAGLNVTGDLTLCAWVRVDDFAIVTHPVFSKGASQLASVFGCYVQPVNNRIVYYHGNNTDASFTILNSVDNYIRESRWFHLGVVRNATTRLVDIYINGVIRLSQAYSASVLPASNTTDFQIGAYVSNRLTGAIFDARIYNATKTPSQIDAIMRDMGGLTDTGSLVSAWLTTNAYTDGSGSGRTLTPTGDPQFIPQGKRIFLDNTYAAAQSVTITPTGSSFRAGVADNLAPGEGVSFFDAFLFDADANLAAGNFQWFWKGV